MILHISRDEKFLDSAINIFECAAPGQNRYVIWQQDSTERIPSLFYKFWLSNKNKIKSQPVKKKDIQQNLKFIIDNKDKVDYADYGTETFFELIGDPSQYKAIVFHSLVYNQAKLAITIRKRLKIPMVWCPFGYEVYNMLPEFKRNIYKTVTAEKFASTQTLFDRAINILDFFKGKVIRKAIKQMDYCAIAIDEEFDLYKDKIGMSAKHSWFSYYPVDRLISNNDEKIIGMNILLGNSSSPSNNHIEAFEFLSNFDLTDRTIIAPLSYGSKKYGDFIAREGKKRFGDKFQYLREFLPLAEYNKMVMSCDIVIMNHSRQEAFGNILTSLWYGATVYINKESTIYQYLNKSGIKVFKIDVSNLSNSSYKLATLSDDEIELNREIIKQQFSFEHIVIHTKTLIKDIMK